MSDILRVNQSQTKILYSILRLQGSNEKSGVSGYMLSKLKTNPIANSTFIDNIRELNKNGLVTKYTATTKTTKYKRKSKKSREKNLYRVNGVGRFALLKSIKPKEFRKATDTLASIPLITSHFLDMTTIARDSKTDIGKHFDKILTEVLRKSISQIEIINHGSKNIQEKITIDYGLNIPSLSYAKLYSVYSKKEEKFVNDYEKWKNKQLPKGIHVATLRFPPATLLEGDTMDRLAFLFYFNLFSLNDPFNLRMLLPWVPEIKVNRTIQEPETHFEYMKLADILNKKIFARIALMIMKDSKLEKVMTQNLNELNENYKKPEALNMITGLFKVK